MRFVFVLLILLIISSATVNASSTCDSQRESIATILTKASARLRSRADQIDQTAILAEETRGEFRTQANWVAAWLTDQSAQIDRKECTALTEFVSTVHAQLEPVVLDSLQIHGRVLRHELDQILNQESIDAFERARTVLLTLEEMTEAGEARRLLRNAVFLARQGVRDAS